MLYIPIYTYILIYISSLYINVLVFVCANNDLSAKTMIPQGIRNPQGLRTQTKAVQVLYIQDIYNTYTYMYICYVCLSIFVYVLH